MKEDLPDIHGALINTSKVQGFDLSVPKPYLSFPANQLQVNQIPAPQQWLLMITSISNIKTSFQMSVTTSSSHQFDSLLMDINIMH